MRLRTAPQCSKNGSSGRSVAETARGPIAKTKTSTRTNSPRAPLPPPKLPSRFPEYSRRGSESQVFKKWAASAGLPGRRREALVAGHVAEALRGKGLAGLTLPLQNERIHFFAKTVG